MADNSTRDLEAVFRDHHAGVFSAAFRVTGNAMDAEDVLQTVFVRLARRMPASAPEDPERLDRYLRRAAVNAALDLRRRAARHPVDTFEQSEPVVDADRTEDGWPPCPSSHATDGSSTWLQEGLRRALATLAPRPAEMFALRYLEGFTNQEIAGLFGTSASSVGVTLHRARARVRDALSESDESELGTDVGDVDRPHSSHADPQSERPANADPNTSKSGLTQFPTQRTAP